MDRRSTMVIGVLFSSCICISSLLNISQVSKQNARRLLVLRRENRNNTRRKRRQSCKKVLITQIQLQFSLLLSDRARRASDPNAIVPPPIRRKDRPSKPNGLTKQTYSVTVNLPGSSEPRKWHVVAYFSVRTHLSRMVQSNC